LDSLFHPARRFGLIFQGVVLLVLGAGGGLAFWSALGQDIGSNLIVYLVLSVLFLAPTPLLMYRLYALTQASYALERDGLRIRWGLRAEDIPLPQIEWIRPANELGFPLRIPLTSSPGAYLGSSRVEGLGLVEYIASDIPTMLLVATPAKVYVISPADPKAFMRSFRRVFELGSLSPLPSRSVRPAAFLEMVWADRPARGMLLAGFFLTAALFILVSLRIPTLPSVSLGFDAAQRPLEAGPAESLLLLAVLGGFAYGVDLLAGLFFYRHPPSKPVAYLLWGASVAVPILLLTGVVMAG
jgi:hypothetical protein